MLLTSPFPSLLSSYARFTAAFICEWVVVVAVPDRTRGIWFWGEGKEGKFRGRRPNGFLGLSLNDRTILFLVILLDKTVSVG